MLYLAYDLYVSKASTQETTRPSFASARESLTARSEAARADCKHKNITPQASKIGGRTEFCEHSRDGLLVGRVDDVGDGGGGGEAKGVHADPALAFGRCVKQRCLEGHFARVPQVVFDGHLHKGISIKKQVKSGGTVTRFIL